MPQTQDYYNTTQQGEPLIELFKNQAATQNERALQVLKQYPKGLTPSQLWRVGFATHYTPLTSIRRALNVCTRRGYCIKTTQKRKGVYGKQEYVWKYRKA